MDTSNYLIVQINFGCYPDPGPYLDLQLYHQRTVGRHVKEWILWMVFWLKLTKKSSGRRERISFVMIVFGVAGYLACRISNDGYSDHNRYPTGYSDHIRNPAGYSDYIRYPVICQYLAKQDRISG